MTLHDWLRNTGTKEEAFAAAIGVDQSTVHRYRAGKRIPNPEVMRRIATETQNRVTANDFYGIAV